MAALFDWVKLILENKWIVILLFGSISGAVGNVTQYFQIEAKDREVEMTQKQVTEVANSYHKVYRHKESVISETYNDSDIRQRIKRLERYH